MSLLATDGLTLRVGQRVLVDGLSVTFAGGQCWAILGANGCGKTTLLHSLAGLRTPDDGSVLCNGKPIGSGGARERARHIGVLFQDTESGFPSTVLELALSGRHPHLGRFAWEGEDDLARARAALAQVGLADFDERWVTTLSGGERRRAEIAALLTQEAPVWLLDEPTSHLDLPHQAAVLALVRQHVADDGRLSVFVLHDVNQALHYATHGILLFANGHWRAGVLADIATRENLERLYGCRLREVTGDGTRYYMTM